MPSLPARTEAADAEIHRAQARWIAETTVVQGLIGDVLVVAQPPDRLAMGSHVQLLKQAVLGLGIKARGLTQIRKNVDVRVDDRGHVRSVLISTDMSSY